jgi:cellobiose-specific phosphotransferase system component IIA
VQAKLYVLLLLVIAAVLLTPGCAGTGQPDTNNTAVMNAPEDMYAGEFNSGFEHHSNASSLFYNATLLWNDDDYADAASLLEQARGEYALAGSHYYNMAVYASNEDELTFAEAMEESVIDMGQASSRYMMSIDQAMADNDNASLEYFQEGQELVDHSMMTLNQSLGYMPSYLG